jgi:molecular chaperone DnaJ
MMFGGGFGNRRSRARGPERGADISYQMEVEFQDAVFGRDVPLDLPRTEACDACHGTGAEPGTSAKTCPNCHGSGQVQFAQNTPFGRIMTARPCERCGGSGSIIEKPCHECGGTGSVRKNRRVTIKVPAGVNDGTRLRLLGEGEAGRRGGPPGDLYVFIRVQPHRRFRREGLDLICEETVSFPKAALGGTLRVETLDGDTQELHIPAGTQSGTVLRIKGRGVPRLGGTHRGDLLVKTIVETPKRLNSKQKELLRALAESMGETVAEDKGFLDKVRDVFKNE